MTQASVWNVGTQLLMLREKPKRQAPQGQSTDAIAGGGLSRSSVEAAVMAVEPRA